MLTNFEQYEPKLKFPAKVEYTTRYYYSKGKVVAIEKTGEEPICPDANGGTVVPRQELRSCVSEKVLDEDAYSKALWAYNNEQALLSEQFRRDLFIDLGIQDNPKRDLLFLKAWERGHAYGVSEVYAIACDLVELIES